MSTHGSVFDDKAYYHIIVCPNKRYFVIEFEFVTVQNGKRSKGVHTTIKGRPAWHKTTQPYKGMSKNKGDKQLQSIFKNKKVNFSL